MDSSNFSHLEQKVAEAIELIKDLRSENSTLRQQREELQSRCETLETESVRMNRELEQTRQGAARSEHFEEKRREIEEKVGGLLEKLEALG